jgi:hypothetical protein
VTTHDTSSLLAHHGPAAVEIFDACGHSHRGYTRFRSANRPGSAVRVGSASHDALASAARLPSGTSRIVRARMATVLRRVLERARSQEQNHCNQYLTHESPSLSGDHSPRSARPKRETP